MHVSRPGGRAGRPAIQLGLGNTRLRTRATYVCMIPVIAIPQGPQHFISWDSESNPIYKNPPFDTSAVLSTYVLSWESNQLISAARFRLCYYSSRISDTSCMLILLNITFSEGRALSTKDKEDG